MGRGEDKAQLDGDGGARGEAERGHGWPTAGRRSGVTLLSSPTSIL
jgi:hypothetical protein